MEYKHFLTVRFGSNQNDHVLLARFTKLLRAGTRLHHHILAHRILDRVEHEKPFFLYTRPLRYFTLAICPLSYSPNGCRKRPLPL